MAILAILLIIAVIFIAKSLGTAIFGGMAKSAEKTSDFAEKEPYGCVYFVIIAVLIVILVIFCE